MDRRTYRKLNSKIKQAWQILEDESCPNCGIPIWIGHSTLGSIAFEVRRTKCYACAAKDQAHKVGKDQSGVTDYVVPVMLEDEELVSRMVGLANLEDYMVLPADPDDGEADYDETEEDGSDI